MLRSDEGSRRGILDPACADEMEGAPSREGRREWAVSEVAGCTPLGLFRARSSLPAISYSMLECSRQLCAFICRGTRTAVGEARKALGLVSPRGLGHPRNLEHPAQMKVVHS